VFRVYDLAIAPTGAGVDAARQPVWRPAPHSFQARDLRKSKGILDLNSGDYLAGVQILGENAGCAAADGRGNDQRIPEADPGLVFNLKGPPDLSGVVSVHQKENRSTIKRALSRGSGDASFRVTVL